jgi:hypothetical protein
MDGCNDYVMVSQQNEFSNRWITCQILRDGFVSQIFTFPKFEQIYLLNDVIHIFSSLPCHPCGHRKNS